MSTALSGLAGSIYIDYWLSPPFIGAVLQDEMQEGSGWPYGPPRRVFFCSNAQAVRLGIPVVFKMLPIETDIHKVSRTRQPTDLEANVSLAHDEYILLGFSAPPSSFIVEGFDVCEPWRGGCQRSLKNEKLVCESYMVGLLLLVRSIWRIHRELRSVNEQSIILT
eukprot:scaffold2482_cov166-Amphora_coffeaeformis.AAC.11